MTLTYDFIYFNDAVEKMHHVGRTAWARPHGEWHYLMTHYTHYARRHVLSPYFFSSMVISR